MTIWKYPLAITDRQTITMPRNAQLLTVQTQEGSLVLWALVRPEETGVGREIAIYGTGNPMPPYPGEYVATFSSHSNALVWHVFDLGAADIRDNSR
jgi:hypothetical protein